MARTFLIILILFCFGVRTVFYFRYARNFRTVGTVRPAVWCIVFGAGLRDSGLPTKILRERLECAADLYRRGKVQRLLLSGGDLGFYHNEPAAMLDFLLRAGIPESVCVTDGAGFRSFDSCRRAKEVFGVEEAILVTQPFHAPRCHYLAESMGIRAQSVPCTHLSYYYNLLDRAFWEVRETAAMFRAFADVRRSGHSSEKSAL